MLTRLIHSTMIDDLQCVTGYHIHWHVQGQCYVWTSSYYTDTSDCLVFPFLSLPYTKAHVRYNLALSFGCFMYDINLGATHTTIPSTRGVTIPIYLVSSTMDSIRQCVVLFKTVTIPTSDLKSEFLCQLSLSCAEPTDPLNHLVCLGYLPRPCHHI